MEHQYHHENDCGCGHDHHHKHHHGGECTDPSCSCHHEHENAERILHSCRGGDVMLESHIHEGAVACTASGQWPSGDLRQEKESLSKAMNSVASWVREQGGFVGHIKASLSYTNRIVFSLTNQEVEENPGGCCARIELAAIVFGVSQNELEQCVLEKLRISE